VLEAGKSSAEKLKMDATSVLQDGRAVGRVEAGPTGTVTEEPKAAAEMTAAAPVAEMGSVRALRAGRKRRAKAEAMKRLNPKGSACSCASPLAIMRACAASMKDRTVVAQLHA
jgi:hypothetical protein